MKPKATDQGTVQAVLLDAAEQVGRAASFDGSVRWELLAECRDPHHADAMRGEASCTCLGGPPYMLAAAYRVGNDMGQGGMVLFGSTDGAQPAEPWGPLRGLLDELRRHQACPDCGGTGRLVRAKDHLAPDKGTYSEDCFCMVRLRDAQRRAARAADQQQAYAAEMNGQGADTTL